MTTYSPPSLRTIFRNEKTTPYTSFASSSKGSSCSDAFASTIELFEREALDPVLGGCCAGGWDAEEVDGAGVRVTLGSEGSPGLRGAAGDSLEGTLVALVVAL